jgi:DNA-binding MarR family transcriptional regulator
MAARKITKAEYEQMAAFRFALRQFLRFSEEAAHAAGVTPQQHQALLAIKGYPSRDQVTVGELAERLQIQHHSAVGLVDRLVSERYLQREQSQEDRRQVLLQLTPRGEDLLGRLAAVHREELRRIGPDLGAFLQKMSS